MNIDTREVVQDPVVPHDGIVGGLGQFHAGIERFLRQAGSGEDQAFDHRIGHGHRDHAAQTLRDDAGLARAVQCQGPVKEDGAFVGSGSKPEYVPGLRFRQNVLQRALFGRYGPVPCGKRPAKGQACRKEGGQSGQPGKGASHDQAFLGSTNIRPRISMCRAWQNHWQ